LGGARKGFSSSKVLDRLSASHGPRGGLVAGGVRREAGGGEEGLEGSSGCIEFCSPVSVGTTVALNCRGSASDNQKHIKIAEDRKTYHIPS